MTADELCRMFIREVIRLHGLPDSITSDRGSLFTSEHWHRVLNLLGVDPHFTTAYHPQANGLVERTNQSLEGYLRGYVAYQQDDWPDLLAMAEFAHNSAPNASSGHSPFYAAYGFHPRFTLGVAASQDVPGAERRVDTLKRIWADVQAELTLAAEDIKRYADRDRLPTPFKVGDLVWLMRKHLSTTCPSSKLDVRRIGPFRITEAIGERAYRLELPEEMRLVHPVFHASLLERYVSPSEFPDRPASSVVRVVQL
jgi:transposase InsO family protein